MARRARAWATRAESRDHSALKVDGTSVSTAAQDREEGDAGARCPSPPPRARERDTARVIDSEHAAGAVLRSLGASVSSPIVAAAKEVAASSSRIRWSWCACMHAAHFSFCESAVLLQVSALVSLSTRPSRRALTVYFARSFAGDCNQR